MNQNCPEGKKDTLGYLFELAKFNVQSLKFRKEALDLVIKEYTNKSLSPEEYLNLGQCYFLIEDAQAFANLLFELLKINDNDDVVIILYYFHNFILT